ncbi:hypothetical protein RHMOL_Rhmol07G0113100 [Rhododendron molle]|uniref:Uncharacterized protein n=1 Tax=Rhododendron molle TaxID=49168 RepID=A0ACC0N1H2_RHOML|nr:hypothetical protein RHMOL_Rhmol07G0113100 [Rhododendron molle]
MKKSLGSIPTSSKIKFDETEEHDSSSDDEGEIERELANVTFEELLKARSNGSHTVYRKPDPEKPGGRANKNRPMEASAKKPVGRFREVIQVPKKVVRDPRFETLCGNLDVEGFKKRYNFLYENELPAEREELKRSMKKSNDNTVIDELKNRISGIDKQLKSASTRTEREILSEHKKRERQAAKQGKRPFYLKKCNSLSLSPPEASFVYVHLQLKFVSRSLLRNTRSSRYLANSNPIWRKGDGRMQRRTTDTCRIDALPRMSNKYSDFPSFQLLDPHVSGMVATGEGMPSYTWWGFCGEDLRESRVKVDVDPGF